MPIIRTSPAHGTAYDIAGLNIATPDSFINALFLARDIYKQKTFGKYPAPAEAKHGAIITYFDTCKPAELEEMESILDLETAQEDTLATENENRGVKMEIRQINASTLKTNASIGTNRSTAINRNLNRRRDSPGRGMSRRWDLSLNQKLLFLETIRMLKWKQLTKSFRKTRGSIIIQDLSK